MSEYKRKGLSEMKPWTPGLDMARVSVSEADNTSSGGVGLLGLVFIVFLALKLTKTGPVALWSWWWVTAPLWGCAALAVVVLAFMALVVVLRWFVDRIDPPPPICDPHSGEVNGPGSPCSDCMGTGWNGAARRRWLHVLLLPVRRWLGMAWGWTP